MEHESFHCGVRRSVSNALMLAVTNQRMGKARLELRLVGHRSLGLLGLVREPDAAVEGAGVDTLELELEVTRLRGELGEGHLGRADAVVAAEPVLVLDGKLDRVGGNLLLVHSVGELLVPLGVEGVALGLGLDRALVGRDLDVGVARVCPESAHCDTIAAWKEEGLLPRSAALRLLPDIMSTCTLWGCLFWLWASTDWYTR